MSKLKGILENTITALALLVVGAHILINGYIWNLRLSESQQVLIGGMFIALELYTVASMIINRKNNNER